MAEYEGTERRREMIQLDEALAEIEKLRGAATTLANAVVNTAQREELLALQQEVAKDFKLKLYAQGALTVAACLFLVIVFIRITNSLNTSIEKGHDVITCLQTKAEAQRTGDAGPTALLLCKQTQKG